MLNKRNRLIGLLLIFALIFVVSVAACGDDDGDKKEDATATPTVEPTEEPTEEPTAEPTEEPTEEPTVEPTEEPTEEPTAEPTEEPTEEPTVEPTEEPTEEPADVEETPAAVAAAEETPAAEPQNLVDVANADGRFTTLAVVLGMVPELGDVLTGEGPYTVFLPTDEAFAAVPDEVVGTMMADPAAIVATLKYHVVEGNLTVDDLKGMESVTTVEGTDLAISVDADGNIVLNDTVKVVDEGKEAPNGMLYGIDGILMLPQPEAEATPVAEAPAEETPAAEEPAAEETPVAEEIPVKELIDCEKYDLSDTKIGLVTDVGQINDKSFNQSSWEGVLSAEPCGATINYIETQDAVDYASNIAEFAEDDYDIVVTVGYALGPATLEAAATYPDVIFIGVDQFQGEAVDNVVGLVFNEDQSGFLAGVLAARLTETNTIAAVLGTDQVPPVVAFKEGYELGAKYVNPDITIISTYHPGAIDQAFTDPEWGATTAKQALDQNADVVFGAGGKTGNGALIEVATAVGTDGPPPYCIGVDTDQWLTVPEAHPCLVSSAMKLLDVGVAEIIMAIADGNTPSGNYFGKAALAPFHEFDASVPEAVKTELEDIAVKLASGELATGYGTAPAEEPAEEETPAAEPATGADLGIIKIGVNAEYQPFEYVDENGNVVGFDVALMGAISAKAGFEVEWVNTRWDGIFVALSSGEFDAVMSAATITEEREQIVDFSNPYFNAGQTIAVREADAANVSVPEDLAGLRVGVQSGTTGDIAASEIEGVEVVRYDEITLAFQALASGDVDAVVNDGPVSADIIAKNPDLGVVLVGDPFTDEFYGIAVQPDKPELLNAINTALADVIADGTYRDIYMEWFGVEPPSMFQPAD